jgi:truncated hemoglobin YjbI
MTPRNKLSRCPESFVQEVVAASSKTRVIAPKYFGPNARRAWLKHMEATLDAAPLDEVAMQPLGMG